MTRKDVEWKWTPHLQKSFEDLKEAFVTAMCAVILTCHYQLIKLQYMIPTVSVEQEEDINLELEALKAKPASLKSPHEGELVRAIWEKIAEASALSGKFCASSSARDAKVTKQTKQLNQFQFGLDLCFLVDVMYSMHPWIKAVRDKVGEVTTAAMTIDSRVIPQVSFVGYRDHCNKERFFTIDFAPMDKLVNLQEQLDKCEVIWGGDGPEDVWGGSIRPCI
ncbi:MHCK/EF2 kinase domain family protein [Planoprotostelium fungivorum]|uniref:MHCK/EF2 kinase domain family protein n=1 Tax=Planoprotostelium fungivorum TaxID=1890364 RepID=A0A2P6MPX2_9EUKA|nr:MHCK/EF2 kinase domain family protein [Planoprotostelium fungivorum]